MTTKKFDSSPQLYATVIGVGYVIFFTSYIIISGQIALNFASSASELKQIETYKGVIFGFFSSLLLFGSSLTLFKRISSDAKKLKQQQESTALAERHAVTGLLTMSIAHDCNNIALILTSATYALERALADISSSVADARTHAERIASSLNVLREMLNRLHKSGREVALGKPHILELDKVIEEAVELAKRHHSFGTSQLEMEIEPGVKATGFAMLINQMVINLVINASEATEGKGTFKVAVWTEAPWAVIEVHDNGPGISPWVQASLFQPYYSTKAYGVGLGLVSVRACVDSNKGTLTISKSPLGGACFRVKIPLTTS